MSQSDDERVTLQSLLSFIKTDDLIQLKLLMYAVAVLEGEQKPSWLKAIEEELDCRLDRRKEITVDGDVQGVLFDLEG